MIIAIDSLHYHIYQLHVKVEITKTRDIFIIYSSKLNYNVKLFHMQRTLEQ